MSRLRRMLPLVRMRNLVLRTLLPQSFYFRQVGFCLCCEQSTVFFSLDPWLRDSFKCAVCRSLPRQRALTRILNEVYPNWRSLIIHESSPTLGGISERFRKECEQYSASQYYPGATPGVSIGHFRNENLESLTLADQSVDIFITQDVLEHVYSPAAAFREIGRVLRPGGAHIFTVPLVNKHRPSQIWATLNDDGSPNFLVEPDFHDNPVDPKGSPVTMHWGFDIIHAIKQASSLETTIEHIDDLSQGIRAEYIEVLVTRRPG